MTQPACLTALLLATGSMAAAAPRPSVTIRPLSRAARARLLRVATALGAGALAAALALSLVGVNGGAADGSPTIRIAVLGAVAIAALLIRGGRRPGAEWR